MPLRNHLRILRTLHLPDDQFVIVSSGVLEVRRLRRARDLDVLVSDSLWQTLSKKHAVQYDRGFPAILLNNSIEIFAANNLFTRKNIASVREVIDTADRQRGVRFMNMLLLKRMKERLNRTKDQKDLSLIHHYLRTHN